MEGGDSLSLSLSLFFPAAGKAGLGLAQKETKGTHACVSALGRVHVSVCVGVCWRAGAVPESGQQGFLGDSISSARTQIRNLPHSRSIWDVAGENAKAPPVTRKTSKSLSCPAHPRESPHRVGGGTKGEPITAGIPRSATALGFLMSLRFVPGERRFGPVSSGARFI